MKHAPFTPRFFRDADGLCRWFAAHQASERELLLGVWKVGSGKASVTWPESVDEALCVGWIDGMRRRIDAQSYSIRFTPRQPTSIWSAVNVARVRALHAEDRMQPQGLAAFAARRGQKVGVYSFEQRKVELPEPHASRLREHAQAWADFQTRPASYRKAAVWWVVSAKQEATRRRRLQQLIDFSERGAMVPPLARP